MFNFATSFLQIMPSLVMHSATICTAVFSRSTKIGDSGNHLSCIVHVKAKLIKDNRHTVLIVLQ